MEEHVSSSGGGAPGAGRVSVVIVRLGVGDDADVDQWLVERVARACGLVGWDVATSQEEPDASLGDSLSVGVEHDGVGELTLVLVDDGQMNAMHERYSGVAGTTDVLTFDHRDDPADVSEPVFADLVLCVDEASRQASQRGVTLREELLLYAVHGIMHLLGEDDREHAAHERMHRREDEVMTKLGLAGLFYKDRQGGEASC